MEWTFNNDLFLSLPTYDATTLTGYLRRVGKSTSWWYRNITNTNKIYIFEILKLCEAASVNPQAMFLCDGKLTAPVLAEGNHYAYGWELSYAVILPNGQARRWLTFMPTNVTSLTRHRLMRKDKPSMTVQTLLQILNDNPELSITDVLKAHPDPPQGREKEECS